ncbi:hypothetical protein O181_066951 [Austropuccinia psidii MF-1]|uniref:Uncharacterized protein n=1 Tax=Austropuccinia psidii MF-1 TaxID=1389203 RepID=A0A9Q3ERX2_9BASI|nr:hypothetical protein [Austropuccinia psidii MF-1]
MIVTGFSGSRHVCIKKTSRQNQSSNVTQSPNPFNTMRKVWVITPHGARQQCDSDTAPPSPPSSLLTHPHPCCYFGTPNPPYDFSYPPNPLGQLQFLSSRCPPDMPPTLLAHQPNPQCHLPSLQS